MNGPDSPALLQQRSRIAVVAAILALLAAAALPTGAAADPSIVGQWRFDELDGQTALDDGPFGLHGQLGASAAIEDADPARVPGASGGAIHLDGTSYVRIADGRRLDVATLTVEAVVRAPSSPGSYRYVVSHRSRGCTAGSYGLYTGPGGGIAFYVFDGERYYVSATASPADVWDNAWHTVSGTFDGTDVRVFVDGRAVGGAFATPTGTAIEYASMPDTTYVGTYVGTCELPFAGDIDVVRIWSTAQSPAAIAQAAGTVADKPPLVPAAASKAIPAPVRTSPTTCSVQLLSKRRVTAGRGADVTVRAMIGATPLRDVRVSLTRAGQRRVLAAKRTNARGKAKLALKAQKAGRLRLGVASRPACVPAFVRVAKRR
ncbi:MAG: hypothetical protein QOJ63_1763 [Solirubrobacteraceae bacterium]|jgi:hypothetical protein|nr:hypothetical protein [Solirubrobacteraceae bacterium]